MIGKSMTIGTTKPQARALAIIAIALAGASLSGCSLLGNIGGGNSGSSGTDSSEAPVGTDTDVFTVKVGDCLNDGGVEGEVSSVKTVDCAEPHDSEAFKSILMDDGDFPGDAAVEEAATTGCTAAFTEFVGFDYETSVLNFSYFFPTEESWGEGDREILCTIVDPAGKTTGTLAGAAR
jgi:Septum formation